MITVLIADDQHLFRDLLAHMLKNNDELNVIACADNGNEAYRLAQLHQPDVILMDIQMPECNGIEAIKMIKKDKITSKILVLTVSQGEEDVSQAVRSGADGYILKSISKDELILAIKSVHMGMEVINKEVRDYARNPSTKVMKNKQGVTVVKVNDQKIPLSAREIKTIQMIVDGLSTQDMANEMFVAEGRMRNIITELIAKLMLKDRTQLAVFAIKNGLVE